MPRTISEAMRIAENKLREVTDPETGECPLDDTICPSVNKSKFREEIVKEVLLSFFAEYPKIVKEIQNA